MSTRVMPLAAALVFSCLAQKPAPDPILRHIQSRLTANELRADVSFLASDALEGRGTPSPGLDVAAEYISSQFRRAGLEPGGDNEYFQTAGYSVLTPNQDGLEVSFEIGGQLLRVDESAMALNQAAAATIVNTPVLRVSQANAGSLTPEDVRGKAVLLERPGAAQSLRNFEPALAIVIANSAPRAANRPALREDSSPGARFAVITVWDSAVRNALATPGAADVRVNARIPEPSVRRVGLRNVVGVLRGSSATLKDTYIVVTAHYDHLGLRADTEGDRIFNGANDNASGVATLIEMARTLAALRVTPKRTIVFIALFGEEAGGLGARYYARHPVFPLKKTIANINLEQIGRTSDTGGGKLLFNLTGFDYTTLAPVFQKAAREAGARAIKDGDNSDSYFTRSDNAVFALAGIPSTTISVTYEFADYHGVGDEWRKIDYENMATVGSAIALGVYRLADNVAVPRWNAGNPKTEPYLKAGRAQ